MTARDLGMLVGFRVIVGVVMAVYSIPKNLVPNKICEKKLRIYRYLWADLRQGTVSYRIKTGTERESS